MKYEVFTTKKGTQLPLMNLKGKPYMQVAHRLVWFTEDAPNYSFTSSFPVLSADETVAHVTVTILSEDGLKIVKQATATKRENKKDFADHTEKAETGALGRALAILGYGTQFAIADLEEGDRLADSPVATVDAPAKTQATQQATTTNGATTSDFTLAPAAAAKKSASAKKPNTKSNEDLF